MDSLENSLSADFATMQKPFWKTLGVKGCANLAVYAAGLVGLVVLPSVFPHPVTFVWLGGAIVANLAIAAMMMWFVKMEENTLVAELGEEGTIVTALAYLWPVSLCWAIWDFTRKA